MWIIGIPMIVVICVFAAGCLLVARDLCSKWDTFNEHQRWFLRLQFVCVTLFVAGMLNFALFWTIAVAIGGDAVSGKIESGHYYVSSHGRLTEVAPVVWTYSYYHTKSIWLTHPVGALSILVLMWSRKWCGDDLGAKQSAGKGPA